MFEVAIYNRDVLECLNEGRNHKFLSNDWAETHYIEVEADNENAARAKVQTKYPETQGFVVTGVSAAA